MASEFSDGAAPKARAFSILVLTVVVVLLIAMFYAQRVPVAGAVEIGVRTCAGLGGLFAVPVLLALGFKNWLSGWRSKLSPWRNELALSSMVLLSYAWLGHFVASSIFINLPFVGTFPHVDPLAMFATLLYSSLFAGLLATALKGNSRLLVVSALLLLLASFQASIYS